MPAYVQALESVYGPPQETGFGSAVFYERLKPGDDLTQAALATYRRFVGPLRQRYGEAAWMGPWKEVYARPAGTKADIAAELRGITDPDARASAPMLLDDAPSPAAAGAALAAAFDDADQATFVVFLMD